MENQTSTQRIETKEDPRTKIIANSLQTSRAAWKDDQWIILPLTAHCMASLGRVFWYLIRSAQEAQERLNSRSNQWYVRAEVGWPFQTKLWMECVKGHISSDWVSSLRSSSWDKDKQSSRSLLLHVVVVICYWRAPWSIAHRVCFSSSIVCQPSNTHPRPILRVYAVVVAMKRGKTWLAMVKTE